MKTKPVIQNTNVNDVIMRKRVEASGRSIKDDASNAGSVCDYTTLEKYRKLSRLVVPPQNSLFGYATSSLLPCKHQKLRLKDILHIWMVCKLDGGLELGVNPGTGCCKYYLCQLLAEC